MHVIFIEDIHVSRFHPLTLTRPLDDLRVGIYTLGQKWEKRLGAEGLQFGRILRDSLDGVFRSNEVMKNDEVLFVNTRFFPTDELLKAVNELGTDEALLYRDEESKPLVIASKVLANKEGMLTDYENYPIKNSQYVENAEGVHRIWDLFLKNEGQIEADLQCGEMMGISNAARISKHAIIEGRDNIFIEEGAVVEAGSILLGEDGPIYVGKNAKILAGAIIRGHVAICESAQVKMAAKIYENTTIGPVCKVGGEVASSIFHSYSNKGHDGFVGNSIIGQWCNFGADSNTSNLKNNYGSVRFADWESKKLVDSGRQFLGTIMGDHSKTAINTMLNTGTICGVSCNLFSSSFPLKYVPSFRWLADDSTRIFEFNKAMEVAERVMSRRNEPLTKEYIRMMKGIFDQAIYE